MNRKNNKRDLRDSEIWDSRNTMINLDPIWQQKKREKQLIMRDYWYNMASLKEELIREDYNMILEVS